MKIPSSEDWVKVQSIRFTYHDIHSVVENFYRMVALDPDLSVPFSSVKDWPHHIERLTHFWWIRFGGTAYQHVSYDPVGKHFESGFNQRLLEKWLALFQRTLSLHLNQDQADLWAEITQSMGFALARNNAAMIDRYGG